MRNMTSCRFVQTTYQQRTCNPEHGVESAVVSARGKQARCVSSLQHEDALGVVEGKGMLLTESHPVWGCRIRTQV